MAKNKRWLVLFVVGLMALAACGEEGGSEDSGGEDVDAGAQSGDCFEEETTTDSGLIIKDSECGDGKTAEAGMLVTVHYVGTLEDGTPFDSSRDRGEPFEFVLGTSSVIQGWDEGVAGMQVGGIRTLTIPPELGYGAAGAGGVIPPNATLVFEIELLEVGQVSPAG